MRASLDRTSLKWRGNRKSGRPWRFSFPSNWPVIDIFQRFIGRLVFCIQSVVKHETTSKRLNFLADHLARLRSDIAQEWKHFWLIHCFHCWGAAVKWLARIILPRKTWVCFVARKLRGDQYNSAFQPRAQKEEGEKKKPAFIYVSTLSARYYIVSVRLMLPPILFLDQDYTVSAIYLDTVKWSNRNSNARKNRQTANFACSSLRVRKFTTHSLARCFLVCRFRDENSWKQCHSGFCSSNWHAKEPLNWLP